MVKLLKMGYWDVFLKNHSMLTDKTGFEIYSTRKKVVS